ncbi:MAG: Holliday junction resolvase RuvX [Myxococcota bacterium]|nr:Holliday junction resolvase RuvX [Myxococcota bacterium]MEC8381377.1 Holliday junction resolvase RuvX [Myxococcota bacterium]
MICLSLDVGTKTIGVARGRRDVGLAQPLLTITRQSVRKDSERLHQLCQSHQARIVIVGLPMMLDGTEGRSARLARQIGTALEALGHYEVHYQDERFSTVEAEKRLIASGKSAKKRKQEIDQAAAAVILENWFLDNPLI